MTTETRDRYVGWGRDESHPSRYWIAIWTEEGPDSAELFGDTREQAKAIATLLARGEGLDAVECDEFGPVAR
jgi:hypothetical protein